MYYCCCWFNWSKRGVKREDYVWLWWFRPYMRQIGEPSGQQLWRQQTSVDNELDSKKRTTTFPPLLHLMHDTVTVFFLKKEMLTCFSFKWHQGNRLPILVHVPCWTTFSASRLLFIVLPPPHKVRVQSGHHFSPSLTSPIWWGWSQVA